MIAWRNQTKPGNDIIDDELESIITGKVNKFVSYMSGIKNSDDDLLVYVSDLFISDLINTILVNNPTMKNDKIDLPNF